MPEDYRSLLEPHAREHGAMAMIHAENADCIEWLTKRLEAAGRTAPRFHAHARPMLVEREAAHRAIALAELVDVPLRLLHIVPTYLPALRYGGPIRSVHALCRALAADGHDVHVFTTSVDGPADSAVPLA